MKLRLLCLSCFILLQLFSTFNSFGQTKPKVIVMSDIGGTEADDTQSLIRFLLYSNEMDIVGLIGANSQFGSDRGDSLTIKTVIDKYEPIRANLLIHANNKEYPTANYLRSIIRTGQKKEGNNDMVGMNGVGKDVYTTRGSKYIVDKLKETEEPIWFLAWGG